MLEHEELIAAVRRNSVAGVRQLLAQDSGLAAIADEKGNTPLHYAAAAGNEAMVSLLLMYNADINAIVKKGGTPINYAAEHGHPEVVQILLEAGADLHIGSGPGHWAFGGETRQEAVLNLLRHSGPVADLLAEAGPICVSEPDHIITRAVRKQVPVTRFLYVGTAEPITHEGIGPQDEAAGILMGREAEILRRGPLTWIYREFSSGVGSYLDPDGVRFHLDMGFAVGDDAASSSDNWQVEVRPAFECASIMFRGSLYDMAHAHQHLRDQLEEQGFTDAGWQLREVYHYFEGVDSAYNITEIQIEVEPEY